MFLSHRVTLMEVRTLVLVVGLLACSKGDPPAPAPTPVAVPTAVTRSAIVQVDRRVELVSIVQRLARGKEYMQAPPSSPYVAAVDAWFAPFASHPAVADAIQDRQMFGVSFDAPMVLAVHLDHGLVLRNPDEIARLDGRFAAIDVAQRAEHLRAFAAEAKLDEFLATQRTHIVAVEAELRSVVDAEDPVRWFDDVFGPAPARFFVVPALLAGTRNYGPRVTLPDGTMELYQLLAATGRDGTIEPSDELVRLLVHEMAHSYINPVFGAQRAALEPAAANVFRYVAAPMQAQAYGDPLTMVNEAGVRATVVMYMHERKGEAAGAAANRAELRASFLWTPELVEVFRKFRRAGTHDLAAFMPEVIAFWNELAARYARDGLPPPRFLGPADAIYQGEHVWTASAALDPYVQTVHQRLRSKAARIAVTQRTLDEHTGRDLVAFGSVATNPVIAQVAAAAGWKLEARGITLGARTFTGAGLVLVACWPRPADPRHGVLVYAAANERDLEGLNYKLRHGDRDWLVARRTPAGTFELVATGDFARGPDGAWLPPR